MTVRPTYAEYEHRRLGHPATRWAGIIYMIRRSFGAPSFGGFWRSWNPLFSYYLYYHCYHPLTRFAPRPVALVLTFAVSGALHDLFASLVTASMYVLFTPVFVVFGLLVIGEEGLKVSLARVPSWLRAIIHTVVIAGTTTTGLALRGAVL